MLSSVSQVKSRDALRVFFSFRPRREVLGVVRLALTTAMFQILALGMGANGWPAAVDSAHGRVENPFVGFGGRVKVRLHVMCM